MRFASLGSGSKGNATVVQQGNTNLLVDCGFSLRELQRRLGRLGLELDDLTAVLLTHEHSDHVSGVGTLVRKHSVPVYATRGTWQKLDVEQAPQAQFINCHEDFSIDDLEVKPFPVPHDAKEPCQFVFGDGEHSLGILTDTGSITPHITNMLSGCNALILECNHDVAMLEESAYPRSLKQRVGGSLGHLSNDQSAHFMRHMDCSALQHFVAAHLSEKNNQPQLVRAAMAEALCCKPQWIDIIDQQDGLEWRALD
ncbi:MAG: MBL fold metallo-hydrolase [Gammaproteobacteria bacterium]|nr:MBL fold metallo-hydrolase [Gammaproteobacteria bacterium]MDH5801840.1 MBL fold metallo-hydrolase [Gammaproteobacteria bacterium]